MKKFSSIEEAFEWWLKNIYPALPADVKVGKYINGWRDYTYNKGISHKRMKDILSDFGDIDEKILITFKLR